MQILTGEIRGQLVRIGQDAVWRGVRLLNCTLAAGPASSFARIEDVSFSDCVFLYDGMEVDSFEWAHLMRRGAERGMPLPRRPL